MVGKEVGGVLEDGEFAVLEQPAAHGVVGLEVEEGGGEEEGVVAAFLQEAQGAFEEVEEGVHALQAVGCLGVEVA